MKKSLILLLTCLILNINNTITSQTWEVIKNDELCMNEIEYATDETIYLLIECLYQVIKKSSDNGMTWDTMQILTPSIHHIRGFECKNSDTAFIHTNFKSPVTYDGMVSIDTIELQHYEYLDSDFHWINDKLYYSFTRNDSVILYLSEDAGHTWSDVNKFYWEDGYTPYYHNLLQSYISEDTAYFFHHYSNDRIYRSIDGGYTVTEHPIVGDTVHSNIFKIISHPGTDFIYFLSDEAGIALRLNTLTWELNALMDPGLGTIKIKDIDFYKDTIYALSYDDKFLYSYDNGTVWHIDTVIAFSKSFSVNSLGHIVLAAYDKIYIKRKTTSADNHISPDNLFNIFPNPAEDIIHIETASLTNIEAVYIFNTIGQKVYDGKDTIINCKNWRPGVYFISIQQGNGQQSFYKLIKTD